MTTEGMVWLNIPDVDRQWVPGGGTRDSERTVGKSCPCPSHNEIATCWWPETLVTAATTQIGQILTRRAVEYVEHQDA